MSSFYRWESWRSRDKSTSKYKCWKFLLRKRWRQKCKNSSVRAQAKCHGGFQWWESCYKPRLGTNFLHWKWQENGQELKNQGTADYSREKFVEMKVQGLRVLEPKKVQWIDLNGISERTCYLMYVLIRCVAKNVSHSPYGYLGLHHSNMSDCWSQGHRGNALSF